LFFLNKIIVDDSDQKIRITDRFEEFVACIMAFALDEKINDDDTDQVQLQKGDDDDDE